MILCCFSCRTVDEILESSDICSIHNVKMTSEKLNITLGYEGYVIDYFNFMKANFPNHRGVRYSHTQSVFFVNEINTYVCDVCAQKYEDYWKDKNRNQNKKND